MNVLQKISDEENVKELIDLPKSITYYDWVVVTGYYSMYMAAQAALSRLGYRVKNHKATILALEEFYVKKKILDEKYLTFLENAGLDKEQIQQLELTKRNRETAQYDVRDETQKKTAQETTEKAGNS